MRIIFLGTSGSMPTPSRGASSVAVKRGREVILFDCGEGTQQKMIMNHIGFRRPMHILISHLHGDHVLGLPGLLQTMSLLGRKRVLDIYGPVGLEAFLNCIYKFLGAPIFHVNIHEIKGCKILYSGRKYELKAVKADHDTDAFSFGLVEKMRPGKFHPEVAKRLGVPEGINWHKLQYGEDIVLEDGKVIRSEEIVDPPRKGRKIVYSGDTRPNQSLISLAADADVLIHEATFDDSLSERAQEDGHSTSSQAAKIAKSARVNNLVLTHISSRYSDPRIILEQATEIFPKTRVARDLMSIIVPLRD